MSQSTYNVFTYGTLCFPEVMQIVTGKHFVRKPAILHGYSCYFVKHQVFPAIIDDSAGVTNGFLHEDIDVDSLARLDEFEDRIYNRETLKVSVIDNQIEVAAEVYVLDDNWRSILGSKPWDPDFFKQHYLQQYIQR